MMNTDLGSLSHDLLDEMEDMDMSDKKVSVFVTEKEKIKVNQTFVLMFVENLQAIMKTLSKAEMAVLFSVVKFAQYKNVFKITQQTIAKDTGMHRSDVSRAFKTLRANKYLLKDADEIEYVNPYLFLKGGIKEFKKTELFSQMQQMQLHFDENDIKNPY
ncbi:hypothetical protein ASF04_26395 [Duganella sp. Leaf61]|nr:hypothetical protein ASF04_26395 [Duganella sp. Leaf61]